MKTFFYVIKWHDGSGQTAGLVQEGSAEDAFRELQMRADYGNDGDILVFNKVDG